MHHSWSLTYMWDKKVCVLFFNISYIVLGNMYSKDDKCY